jgi:MFS family permease
MPLVFSTVPKTSTLSTGPAITSVSTIGYLGFLTGPPLIGFISQATNFRISFLLLIAAGIGIMIVSSLKTSRG